MWEEIGYIMASNYRRNVVEKLSKKNYMPSILAKEINVQLSHISRALKELEDRNIVKCLNKKSKKGKIYSLTELGKSLAQIIESEL